MPPPPDADDSAFTDIRKDDGAPEAPAPAAAPAIDDSTFTDIRKDDGAPEAPAPAPAAAGDAGLMFSDEVGGRASSASSEELPSRTASQRLTKAKLDELKGQVVGDCTLEALIGKGSMGAVFSATSKKLGKRVAVKVLDPKLSNDTRFVNRFVQEAQTLALLDNPHVVRVHAFDKDDSGRHYIVMELVEGGSVLRMLRAKGKLEIDEAVRIASEAAKGLQAAHRQDLVHRDVKPANLLIAKDGRVKVGDFGLAVPTQGEVFLATEVVGTPIYMAPEQADGLRLDGHCDQYALGVTLYQLICGKPPFDRKRPVDVIKAHMTEPPPPPHDIREDVPAWLEDVILKMLAKARTERFASMAEVHQALDSRGAGVKPVDRDRLVRPAVTVDASRFAAVDAKTARADAVKMPGWTATLLVAGIATAASVLALRGGAGEPLPGSEPAAVPHVVARALDETRALAKDGSAPGLSAALERARADALVLAAEPGAPLLRDLAKELEAKLAAKGAETVAALRARSSALVAKGRFAAALESVTVDEPTRRVLGLDAALGDLRAEVAAALARERNEVYVPAGKFRSGPDAVPAMLKAFYVGRTEVTNADWAKAVESKAVAAPASWPQGKLPEALAARPVTGITFEEAERFARSIGARLPTAAEWERAARGSADARAWPWGDAFTPGAANVLDGGSGALEDVTARAGDISPSGALGLGGNALEWVGTLEAPLVAGGGFASDPLSARVFTRLPLGAKEKDPAVGFRWARDVEGP